MATSREEFIALVKQLEQVSKRDPSAYRVRLGMLAILGYAFIFGVFLVVVGLLAGIVMYTVTTGSFMFAELKLVFFLLILAGVILRSLWVKVSPPEGIPLRRADVPQLFQLIDTLSDQLKSSQIDQVLLTNDFNAAVAQIPRLGLFGWYKNYLILGYALLQSLSPEQFRAVLAHEMGHLSAQHGRFGVWIWRLRTTWGRLVQDLQGSHNGAIFNWFLKWYGPYFMAYSFVLARADEYEADRHGGRLTNARTMVEGLVATHVRDKYIDKEFWAKLTKHMQENPAPPPDPYTRLANTLHQPMSADDAQKWLALAVVQQTDYDDTHPALRDRVAALGFPEVLTTPEAIEAFLPGELRQSAAEQFLGHALPHFTDMLNKEWVGKVTPIWQKKHKEAQQGLSRLQALTEKLEQGETLDRDESWEHARLTAQLHGMVAAKPLLQALLATWPEFTPAKYALGQTLLEEEDESGIELMVQAMYEDQDFILPGCQIIYGYLKQHGRDAEAEPFLNRGMQQMEMLQAAEQQVKQISPNDNFQPHELSAEAIQNILTALGKDQEISVAYLVRKILPAQPERICHVLSIKPRFKGMLVSEDDARKKMSSRTIKNLGSIPQLFVVILSNSSHKALEKKMKQVANAQIYRKK